MLVTSNPPYMNDNHGLKNPDLPKAIARHEVFCTLDDVCREASLLLKSGGRFYMVHRPHRLAEIITSLKTYKLEPKRMKLVHPFADKEANMVLIEAVRGGKSMMKVEAPIIVYKEPGVYTHGNYDVYGYLKQEVTMAEQEKGSRKVISLRDIPLAIWMTLRCGYSIP